MGKSKGLEVKRAAYHSESSPLQTLDAEALYSPVALRWTPGLLQPSDLLQKTEEGHKQAEGEDCIKDSRER